jgi:hypothetical protein
VVDSTNTSSSTRNSNNNRPAGKTLGAIVGGAIAGSIGVLVIAAFIWYYLRRHRRSGPKFTKGAWLENGFLKAELHSEAAIKGPLDRSTPELHPEAALRGPLDRSTPELHSEAALRSPFQRATPELHPGYAAQRPMVSHELGSYSGWHASQVPRKQEHELP